MFLASTITTIYAICKLIHVRWEEFINTLQLRFIALDKEHTLKLYKVPSKLKNYTTTLWHRKQGIVLLPESKYRLRDLEIKGSKEYEEAKTPV